MSRIDEIAARWHDHVDKYYTGRGIASNASRNAAIISARRRGNTVRAIAESVGVTEHVVNGVIKRAGVKKGG